MSPLPLTTQAELRFDHAAALGPLYTFVAANPTLAVGGLTCATFAAALPELASLPKLRHTAPTTAAATATAAAAAAAAAGTATAATATTTACCFGSLFRGALRVLDRAALGLAGTATAAAAAATTTASTTAASSGFGFLRALSF